MVVVGIYTFPDQAMIARGLLESENIPCFLENEHTLGLNWNLTNALGGLRLAVPEAFEEQAKKLLEEMELPADEELPEEEGS